MVDYIVEYGKLLKETVCGANIRALVFGYRSKTLDNYLDQQKYKIYTLRNNAFDAGQEVHTRKNLDLNFKLFSLETRVMKYKMGVF